MKALTSLCLASLLLSNLAFADVDLEQAAAAYGLSGQVTTVADGIDIYSSIPSVDGENHYVHISSKKDSQDKTRYVFQYCRDGLPLQLAEQGAFPKNRDCYLQIGNPEGYTQGEIQNELDLMLEQAKSQSHSQLLSTLGSSVASGVVVLVALNLVEAVTTGGAANVVTDGAAASGVIARYFGGMVVKKVAIDGSKLLISTVIGTFLGQSITNKVAQADTRTTNENAFSTPAEMKDTANVVQKLLTSGSVVIVHQRIESFEKDLSQILNKIQ